LERGWLNSTSAGRAARLQQPEGYRKRRIDETLVALPEI